jgi:phosphinothricin acetyltransferase
MSVRIESMVAADWPMVAEIYREGIASGNATFAPAPPENFADFSEGKLRECACVARDGNEAVAGWATLAKVSDRCVYAGVAEVSIYVAAAARGRGVGEALMRTLIARAESAGVWTLQAGIFPENTASLRLHVRHGFREVGRRERLGQMPPRDGRAGEWRDVLLLERRSKVAGV